MGKKQEQESVSHFCLEFRWEKNETWRKLVNIGDLRAFLNFIRVARGVKPEYRQIPIASWRIRGSLIIKSPARSLWSIITDHLCFSSKHAGWFTDGQKQSSASPAPRAVKYRASIHPDPLRASGPGRAEPRRSQRAGRHGVSGVTEFGFPSGLLSLAVVRQHLVHQRRRRGLFPRDSVGKRDDAFSKLSPSRQPGVRR